MALMLHQSTFDTLKLLHNREAFTIEVIHERHDSDKLDCTENEATVSAEDDQLISIVKTQNTLCYVVIKILDDDGMDCIA